MIAVTIGTGEYYTKLAHHAANAIEKMTGLKTVILGDEHHADSGLPYSHHLILRIFDLVDHDEVMFFDSDMVCLKTWNPPRFAKADAVVAVAERLHPMVVRDRKSTRLNSSHRTISYAVFCLKKKNKKLKQRTVSLHMCAALTQRHHCGIHLRVCS